MLSVQQRTDWVLTDAAIAELLLLTALLNRRPHAFVTKVIANVRASLQLVSGARTNAIAHELPTSVT